MYVYTYNECNYDGCKQILRYENFFIEFLRDANIHNVICLYEYPKHIIDLVAGQGQLNVIKYLCGIGNKFTKNGIYYAKKYKHYDVVDYLESVKEIDMENIEEDEIDLILYSDNITEIDIELR